MKNLPPKYVFKYVFGTYWLAPGELPVEAQFSGFQQGARGASLVTNNRPRWCADIETGYKGP